jgi:hypothetical protein
LVKLKLGRANFSVKVNNMVKQHPLLICHVFHFVLNAVDAYDLGLLVCHIDFPLMRRQGRVAASRYFLPASGGDISGCARHLGLKFRLLLFGVRLAVIGFTGL